MLNNFAVSHNPRPALTPAPSRNAASGHNAPLFSPGRIDGTPDAMEAIENAYLTAAEAGKALTQLVRRHVSGDWGEVDAHDKAINDKAVLTGAHIVSAYTLPTSIKIWIITDAGHATTTILLPSEY